jgi:hypothetical protein
MQNYLLFTFCMVSLVLNNISAFGQQHGSQELRQAVENLGQAEFGNTVIRYSAAKSATESGIKNNNYDASFDCIYARTEDLLLSDVIKTGKDKPTQTSGHEDMGHQYILRKDKHLLDVLYYYSGNKKVLQAIGTNFDLKVPYEHILHNRAYFSMLLGRILETNDTLDDVSKMACSSTHLSTDKSGLKCVVKTVFADYEILVVKHESRWYVEKIQIIQNLEHRYTHRTNESFENAILRRKLQIEKIDPCIKVNIMISRDFKQSTPKIQAVKIQHFDRLDAPPGLLFETSLKFQSQKTITNESDLSGDIIKIQDGQRAYSAAEEYRNIDLAVNDGNVVRRVDNAPLEQVGREIATSNTRRTVLYTLCSILSVVALAGIAYLIWAKRRKRA